MGTQTQLWLCRVALACVFALAAVSAQPPPRSVYIWVNVDVEKNMFLGVNTSYATGEYLMRALSFRHTRGLDPVDSELGVRPIELQVLNASLEGISKVKLFIPEPENRNPPYLLWVTTSGNPPQLWLTTNANQDMDLNEWTSEWFMDNTAQPDGTESVRFYTYAGADVRPFNLAASQTGSVHVVGATRYLKMIDADRFPFTTDWTPQVVNPYPWTAEINDACSSLVRRGAWANNVIKCGLSLTDACDAPPLMSHNDWQTWKQSVRRISSTCDALMTSFEGCCQQRDLTRAASPQDTDAALRLIPWTNFRNVLPQCVSREQIYVLRNGYSTPTPDMAQDFHIRGLCERMMFSQTAVRPYLMPLHACLSNYMSSFFGATGAYFEPEAYFSEMCLSNEARSQFSTQAGITSLVESGFLSTPTSTTTTTGGTSSSSTKTTSATTTGTTAITTGTWTTTAGNTIAWSCPTGWAMAEPIGTDPARCYKRFLYHGEGGGQAKYRLEGESGSCAMAGARLATWRSESEFSTLAFVCADQQDMSTYLRWGCWLDGYAAEPESFKKTGWVWRSPDNSADTTAHMLNAYYDHWADGQPSGYDDGQPENCMHIWAAEMVLNDAPCDHHRAALCMQDATVTDGTSSTAGDSTTGGTSSTTGPTTDGSSSTTGPTTDGSSSTTGASNTDGWTCAADSNRCYLLQQNLGGYQHQDGYRSTCAAAGGRLATFTSWSEFTTIQSVCGDVTTWGQPGCWIDGVATDDYEAGNPSNTAWRWPTDGANGSPDSNDFLINTQPNQFWSSGQPSGWNYWGTQEERCLQVMGNGLLNDQECYTSLAGVCMIEV